MENNSININAQTGVVMQQRISASETESFDVVI